MSKSQSQQYEQIGQTQKSGFYQSKGQKIGIMKRTKINQIDTKTSLILELEEVLKYLSDVSKIQIVQKTCQVKDPIMQKLQQIQKRAQFSNLRQIQKLCMLGIGKRILNIQLRKKRGQFQKVHVQQYQETTKEVNRIKKFDYEALIQEKLKQNTLIVRPYTSGKGFIASDIDYPDYKLSLEQCNYTQVVRSVNKIFFDIFSGKKKDKKTQMYDILFKLLWIPIIILIVLIVGLPFYSIGSEQIILSILVGIVILILGFIAISTYLIQPNSNNQIQQSIQDTKKYFNQLNAKNILLQKNFQWSCPQNFMYLEVHLNNDLK